MEQLGQEDPKASQRLLWATLVLAIIFAAWAFFMRPTGPQKAEKPPEGAANTAVPSSANNPVEAPATPAPKLATEAAASSKAVAAAEESSAVMANGDLSLELCNRGAVIRKAVLMEYAEGDEKDDLVSPLAKPMKSWPLALATGDAAYDAMANDALFHVERTETAGGIQVQMTWSDDKGNGVQKKITLPPKGYEATIDVSAMKAGTAVSPVSLQWGPGFGKLLASQAKNRYYQQEYVGLYEAGSYKIVTRKKAKAESPEIVDSYGATGPIAWAGITNSYFAAVFVPDTPMSWVRVVTEALSPERQAVHPAETAVRLVVGFPGHGKVYIGPKEYVRLRGMGDSFHRLLDWGTYDFSNPILEPICAILLWSLKKLFGLTRNYGIAIILLTLLIKLAFYPLTQRSMVKMKEMSEQMKKLKPQIDRIKSKYKKMGSGMDTRAKMNEEMMALYQREGINPLGQMSGCLPLFLQMPIFIALFTLLPKTLDLRGAAFLGWIHDLSVPDPFYVTPILMGVSMVASTRMTSTQGLEGAQKMMLWFMPIMFTWFCLWAPAGLTLYWLTNNLLTMAQQAIINKQVAERQEAVAKARKSTPKGASKPS